MIVMKYSLLLFILMSPVGKTNEVLKDWALNIEDYEKRCDRITEPNTYESELSKKLAIGNFFAQAQYYALRKILVYVADSAKNLSLLRPHYINVVKTIIQNQCSDNMTIISKKSLHDLAILKFDESSKIASYTKSDYMEGIKLLADFCSWYGTNHTDSMITYYLKDPLVANIVIQDYIKNSNRVLCDETKCRLTDLKNFSSRYQRAINQKSFENELNGLYCFNIKNINQLNSKLSDNYTKARLKESEDSLKKSKIYLYASFANLPAPIVLNDWTHNTPYFFSKIIDDENSWSKDILRDMSKRVEMEEELNVRFHVNKTAAKLDELTLDFDIHGDDFDQIVYNVDKLSWGFEFKIKKAELFFLTSEVERIYQRHYSTRTERIENLTKSFADKIREGFWKEKLLKVPTLKYLPDFPNRMSEALISTLKTYKGPKSEFVSTSKSEAVIPLKISFGWEALRKLARLRRLDNK